jgi:transportin-3
MTPLLPALAQKLVQCFETSKNGCFLWVSSAVIREFSDGAENVDQNTSDAIYQFFERQTTTMLRQMNEIVPAEQPDVFEDFFRLLTDAVLYYPEKLLTSTLFAPIFEAALVALTISAQEPLIATLHYLRDVLSYGGLSPSSSTYTSDSTPPALRQSVQSLIMARGELLVQRIIAGLLFSFPRDCIPDGSGVLFDIVEIAPGSIVKWIGDTIALLPAGTVSQAEVERLLTTINGAITARDFKKIRYTMQGRSTSLYQNIADTCRLHDAVSKTQCCSKRGPGAIGSNAI